MNFETVMQAYNAYKNTPTKTLEARANAINTDIAGNPSADIQAYNVELEAIERVIEERGQATPKPEVPEVAFTAKTKGDAQDVAATPEYRAAFFKTLQGAKLTADERRAFDLVNVEHRSSEFNTLSNAAAIVPTTTLNEVVSKARKQGGIMSIARSFNVPSNVSIPVGTPGSAAQWHTEGQAVDTEKANVASVKFAGNELMKVLSLSAATQSMSISSFEAYITDELTSSIMAALSQGMVSGTGEGQATGILTGIDWIDAASASEGDVVNMVTVAADDELGFADILAAIAMLKRGYSAGAKFVCNNITLYQDIYGIHDEVNRPVYLADLVNAGPGRILGFDVVIDDYLPDHDVLFGNFAYYGFNMPAGIAIDMSRDSSFKSGLVDYRALCVCDAKCIVAEAFTRISKATE